MARNKTEWKISAHEAISIRKMSDARLEKALEENSKEHTAALLRASSRERAARVAGRLPDGESFQGLNFLTARREALTHEKKKRDFEKARAEYRTFAQELDTICRI